MNPADRERAGVAPPLERESALPASRAGGGLSAALNPRSIAVIGASDNPNKIGGRPLLYLAQFGFRGAVYPINPNRLEVQGRRCYPDVAALPEAPDLVIVAAPTTHVVQAVDDCAARGAKAAIVMASGFGEMSDASAVEAERGMVVRARAAGMRIVGPNSQGLANFGTGAVASFSTMFIEVEPADGPVGIISQSGMMSVAPYGLLRRRGIGVRHAHATGNDADVTLSELALAVVEDEAVRLLLLYIESIQDAPMLARVAAAARERDVPIVAVKTGRTASGQAAARSHTGALANEDRVVDAFFREHGIWRVDDVHELVSASEAYLKGWRPSGRRLVVVSNSGAACVMAADAAPSLGLALEPLAAPTAAALAAQLPNFATVTNPVDVTAALLTNSSLLGGILSVLAETDDADLLLLSLPVAGAGYDVGAFATAAADYARVTGRPIAVASPQESVAAYFGAAGVPVFANQTDAIRVLAQLAHHAQLMRKRPPIRVSPASTTAPPGRGRFLGEAQGMAFLQAHGLPMVAHRLCRTANEARMAFRELGPRVAVKACSPDLPHKSDSGLVVLDIDNEADVVLAFTDLETRMDALGATVDGVIVARMAKGRREMVLGAKVDPVFGPVVMVGDGGRYVEALDDIALLFPPFTVEQVRDALSTLRLRVFLEGRRGDPPMDVEPLCRAAVRLGEVIVGAGRSLASIDLNPVIVGAEGEGVVVVDALVERSSRALADTADSGSSR